MPSNQFFFCYAVRTSKERKFFSYSFYNLGYNHAELKNLHLKNNCISISYC